MKNSRIATDTARRAEPHTACVPAKNAGKAPLTNAPPIAPSTSKADASSAVGQMSQALFASRIEVPTLGITADLFARAMQPSDFAAGLTVRCIDGAGHFVHLEAAETVNRAIIEFMSQHER